MDSISSLKKIAIAGAGSWGTALAFLLASKNYDVSLFTRNDKVIADISSASMNTAYMPGLRLPENITASKDFSLIASYDLVVNAVPTQYISSFYKDNSVDLSGKYLVNVSKGIEQGSVHRVSQIFEKYFGVSSGRYCILTGPSHAEEVALLVPTTVVSASLDEGLAKQVQDIFTTDWFRVYSSTDVTGCEIGGAFKNVIAIAAGIIDGLQFAGDNTKAALLTRGLAEISRLGLAMGADQATFSGLSGLGDLFVTCNSKHSRNRRVGEKIGKGEKPSDILSATNMVAEGVFTSRSVHTLSSLYKTDMPICDEVYDVLFEDKDPKEAIHDLMTRESKSEKD